MVESIRKRRTVEKKEVKVVQKVEKKYKVVKKKEEEESSTSESSDDSDTSDSSEDESEDDSSESSSTSEGSSSSSDSSDTSDSGDEFVEEKKTVKITIQKRAYRKRRKKSKINLPESNSTTKSTFLFSLSLIYIKGAVLSNYPEFTDSLTLFEFPPHPQYLALFYAMVCERQSIAYKRDILKEPEPWTQSEIMTLHNFTNVQRELDPGTKYFQNQIRGITNPKTVRFVCFSFVYN